MARRTVDWNEGLAKDLQDPEFAKKVKLPSSNIIRAINPKHNPTYETLNKLLKPFKLKVGITPITGKKAA
jgi:DNA-binding phage protein